MATKRQTLFDELEARNGRGPDRGPPQRIGSLAKTVIALVALVAIAAAAYGLFF